MDSVTSPSARAEWQGGRVVRRVKVFILEWPTIMESGALCIGQWLMLCVFALKKCCSYWLLIDVCIGFGLMLCKLVFNWFMSFRKNKVSSFLKFVAAHFIELDSSSNLSTHPPVILHAGLARSCRIHCFKKWQIISYLGKMSIDRSRILSLRLRLRAEWMGGRHIAK